MEKYLWMSSAAVVIGTLRVKWLPLIQFVLFTRKGNILTTVLRQIICLRKSDVFIERISACIVIEKLKEHDIQTKQIFNKDSPLYI